MYGLCFPLHVVMSGQLSECRDLSSPMGTCGMVGTASQRTCADICWPLVLGVGLHRGSLLLTFSDLLGFPASGLHGSFCVPHVSAAAFIPSDSLGPSCAPLEHRVTCGCSCLMLRALGKTRGFREAIVHMGPGQARRCPTALPEVGASVVQLLPESFGGSSTAQLSSPQMLRGFCWFSLTLGFHLKVVQPRCLLMSDSLSYLLRLCLFFAWFSSPGSPSLLLDPQSHATQCITPLSGSPL